MSEGRAGFTLVELMVTITIAGIVMALGVSGFRGLTRQQQTEGLVRAVLWEVTVARSYALLSDAPMALVADEANRRLVLRDAFGTVYRSVTFDRFSDLKAITLDIGTPGDSLAFSARGLCLNCSTNGTTAVTVSSAGGASSMRVNWLGRPQLMGYGGT